MNVTDIDEIRMYIIQEFPVIWKLIEVQLHSNKLLFGFQNSLFQETNLYVLKMFTDSDFCRGLVGCDAV